MTLDQLKQHIFLNYAVGTKERQWLEIIERSSDGNDSTDRAYQTGYDDGYNEGYSEAQEEYDPTR